MASNEQRATSNPSYRWAILLRDVERSSEGPCLATERVHNRFRLRSVAETFRDVVSDGRFRSSPGWDARSEVSDLRGEVPLDD